MGDYYDHDKMAWVKRKISIPPNAKCLCWLSECNCNFQRHIGLLTFCDDPEIFRKCLNNEDINYGDDD